MDNVKVHYNSDKPAEVQALAYAQGTDIHVAPGQEKHLPHEAWHVVQQAQGRVKPNLQLMNMKVNDNAGLEKEADEMGAIALRSNIDNSKEDKIVSANNITLPVAQMVWTDKQHKTIWEYYKPVHILDELVNLKLGYDVDFYRDENKALYVRDSKSEKFNISEDDTKEKWKALKESNLETKSEWAGIEAAYGSSFRNQTDSAKKSLANDAGAI